VENSIFSCGKHGFILERSHLSDFGFQFCKR
jgi:hypothetical protein